jgi:hypothetical protein
MSQVVLCGRVTPRWSVARHAALLPALNAGLVFKIAMVGVLPGALICSGPNAGSAVETTPSQPLLLSIRLPLPADALAPLEHSSLPLFATMELRMMKLAAPPAFSLIAMPPVPLPVAVLPLMVEL